MFEQLLQIYHTLPDFFRWLIKTVYNTLSLPNSQQSRLYWVYLVSALILGIVAYYYYQLNKSHTKRYGGLLAYLFPREIYTHPSSLVDYQVFVANRLSSPITRLLVGVIPTALVAAWVVQALGTAFPGWSSAPVTGWTIALGTLLYAMASDFGSFVNHWLHHRYSLLWPLHRIHHSAEVLNPVTAFRKHPLYDLVKSLTKPPITGTLQGIVLFMVLGEASIYTILGLNSVFAVFNLMGSNLRHTHIWISFGTVLNHVFVSPAHHQIHHSARPEHRDRNLGEVFALWDWMFGTLVLPSEEIRRNMVYGLAIGAPQMHPSLARAYIEPVTSIIAQVRNMLFQVGKSIRGLTAERGRAHIEPAASIAAQVLHIVFRVGKPICVRLRGQFLISTIKSTC